MEKVLFCFLCEFLIPLWNKKLKIKYEIEKQIIIIVSKNLGSFKIKKGGEREKKIYGGEVI